MSQKMLQTSLLIAVALQLSIAMNAILLDGQSGKTQLYKPGATSISKGKLHFGLPNLYASAAVMYNKKAYFIGGQNVEYNDNIIIFDPRTNTSSEGPRLNHARGYHKATVVGESIIVCGGINNADI